MAYCVNCGVELAPSERACPLCKTQVNHPTQPWREPEFYPYPQGYEQLTHRVNRRYGTYLATILLLIPLAVTGVLDLLDNHALPWSLYVLGAGFCVFVMVLFPFYITKQKPYLFLALDALAIGLYLVLIGHLSGSMDWVWMLALPLVAVIGLSVLLATWLGRRSGKKILNLLADIALILGGMVVLGEVLIDQFLWQSVYLTWSLYTLIPLLAVAALFRIVERKEKLKSNILRRLFV